MSTSKKLFLILLTALLSSCSVHNRLTSPEVLEKEERIWSYGASLDPLAITEYGALEDPIAVFQPVISYRSGIGRNQELGITLYGLVGPAFVLDHKHRIKEWGDFQLSGDVAVFLGIFRPVGAQYDLMFGKREIYGSVGLGYDAAQLVSEEPYYQIGFGSERVGETAFGIQVSYGRTFTTVQNDPENYLSIGIKFDLKKTKRKYRD